MSAWLRRSLYSGFGLLWLTGGAWLTLHLFFPTTTEFGPAPHPWEPRLMVVHGIVALVVVFLFGWISGTHIGENWRPRLRRTSGIWLTALIALLSISGLANYYLTSETARSGTAAVHEILGVASLLPA